MSGARGQHEENRMQGFGG